MPEKPKRQIPQTEAFEADMPPLDEENLPPDTEVDTNVLPKLRTQMKGWEAKAHAKNPELQEKKIQEEARRQSRIKKIHQELKDEIAEEKKYGPRIKKESVTMEEINAESARWRATVDRLETEGKLREQPNKKEYNPEFEIAAKELETYEEKTKEHPLVYEDTKVTTKEIDAKAAAWKRTVGRLEAGGKIRGEERKRYNPEEKLRKEVQQRIESEEERDEEPDKK